MRKNLFLFIGLLMTLGALPAIGQVQVSSAFSPSVANAGDSVGYQIIITGGNDPQLTGQLPAVDGLTIGNRPSVSQNVSVVNGSTTRTLTYTFPVRTTREGTFTVPSFPLRIDGKDHSVPAVALQVVPPGEEMKGAMMLELNLPRQLFTGQSTNATLTLWVRNDMRLHEVATPTLSGDGFLHSGINNNIARQEARARDGATYQVVEWPLLVTALKQGTQALQATIDIGIEDSSASRGRDPFDRMFGGSMFNRQIRTTQQQTSAETRIEPLPADGRPENFSGAIGTFTLSDAVSAESAHVGEPIAMELKISGSGNFSQIVAPPAPTHESWRSYPPASNFEKTDTLGQQGTLKLEYLLTPMKAGKLPTPPFTFSYFDPAAREYRTLEAAPRDILVARAEGVRVLADSGETGGSPASPGDRRLRDISLLPSPWIANLTPAFTEPLFWGIQAVPAGLLAGIMAFRLRSNRLSRNPSLAAARRHRVNARQHLRKAKNAQSKGDSAEFLIQGRRALQYAAAARAPGKHPESVDATALQDQLKELGINPQAMQPFFTQYDSIRFGGMVDAGSLRPEQLAALGTIIRKLLRSSPR